MKLSDYLDINELAELIMDGKISVRDHDDDPDLLILNYTPKAQAAYKWPDTLRKCRGLIVRVDPKATESPWDGAEVVARPFPKFFNHNEAQADKFRPDEWVQVSEKLDGSLGVLYPHPDGGWAVASRGSFHSDQAKAGTDLLRWRIGETGWQPEVGITYLFEIIYPENRIVVDYGDRRELVLIWANPTDPDELLDGRLRSVRDVFRPSKCRVERFEDIVREVLESHVPNAEGFVISGGDGRMVKVKYDDYVALHRIVFGLNETSIWEAARDWRLKEWIGGLPEEFHEWAWGVYDRIVDQRSAIQLEAIRAHSEAYRGATCADLKLDRKLDRRRYAEVLSKMVEDGLISTYARSLAFTLLDRKYVAFNALAWKLVKPKSPKAAARDLSEAA